MNEIHVLVLSNIVQNDFKMALKGASVEAATPNSNQLLLGDIQLVIVIKFDKNHGSVFL